MSANPSISSVMTGEERFNADNPKCANEGCDEFALKTDARGRCEKHKPILYCIAYMYRVKFAIWKGDMLYLHALDDGDARLQFFHSEPPKNRRHIRISGIAPVIGYHVNDKKGDRLSV